MIFWSKLSFPQNSIIMLGTISLVLLPVLFYFLDNKLLMLLNWELISFSSFNLNFSFMIDKMSLIFSMAVLMISFSVMLFSVTYMSNDTALNYFIIMVMAFVLSMNMLIFVPHLIFLLLGWDGLGLTSYLLVIYYQNDSSLSAGMITGITNRVGDSLLILSGSWAFMTGSWDQTFIMENSLWCSMVIMLAAMTKSAQMPFSSWLPAAMAAPTPVSSLVHSSTLVTAGIYLLIRFYPTLSMFKHLNSYAFWVGFITCTMASLSAILETDLKKVVALSTLSQLGIMFISLGMGQPLMTFFHLITHAMFKALLFICSGTMIHCMSGVQDLRLMGAMWNHMPATTSCLNIANLALCGIPFTAGFYSKDLILENVFSSQLPLISYTALIMSICLTSAYSIRLSFMTLWSSSKHYSSHKVNDESLYVLSPCFVLTLGAISSGVMISWALTPFMFSYSFPFMIKTFGLLMILMYGSIMFWFNYRSIPVAPLKSFNSSMWFLSLVTSNAFLPLSFNLSSLYVINEQTWMEILSGTGSLSLMSKMSKQMSKSQNFKINSLISSMAVITISLMIMFYL